MSARTLVRLGFAIALLAAHRELGGWLATVDPIGELLDGRRIQVGFALAALVPLRFAAWFVVVPWVAAGTLADALRNGRETPSGERVE